MHHLEYLEKYGPRTVEVLDTSTEHPTWKRFGEVCRSYADAVRLYWEAWAQYGSRRARLVGGDLTGGYQQLKEQARDERVSEVMHAETRRRK